MNGSFHRDRLSTADSYWLNRADSVFVWIKSKQYLNVFIKNLSCKTATENAYQGEKQETGFKLTTHLNHRNTAERQQHTNITPHPIGGPFCSNMSFDGCEPSLFSPCATEQNSVCVCGHACVSLCELLEQQIPGESVSQPGEGTLGDLQP